ncbi:hypothetical protein OA871_02500 [Paracoccaceae bacterium]|nr:hypothetical protein [Paracoccaceae bacterium]
MKKVLLTTTAIVGLSAPAFAADPTAVSDQPYFHHSHPMTWSGAMSIKLTNQSSKDADAIVDKAAKRDFLFGFLANDDVTNAASPEETYTGNVIETDGTDDTANTTNHGQAVTYLENMRGVLNGHASYTLTTAITAADSSNVSAVEDIIDDFLGGSHSEAMDVMVEVYGNGVTPNASAVADLTDDIKAFQASQDAGAEAIETTASINTTASLGVAMTAGDGWTATTSGSFNLGGGSVSGGTLSMSNGMLTLSVGKTQHAATAAVSAMYGMDVALDTNSADTQLQATMALGGATVQVDNEMDGDNLETKSQTVGVKGSYGTMSYGLGWQADGDLGFSLGTSLGGIGLTVSRVNAGSTYSMGLAATMDLGGGMTLSASNAQNSDGLQDKSLTYSTMTVTAANVASFQDGNTITEAFALKAVHKSISTVGISYAGGGTSVGITYHEKAGTSAAGDNLIASGSMAISPTITLTGSYNKDDALTTIGASGPLGSAGTLSAVMTSTGSSTLTASFKF